MIDPAVIVNQLIAVGIAAVVGMLWRIEKRLEHMTNELANLPCKKSHALDICEVCHES